MATPQNLEPVLLVPRADKYHLVDQQIGLPTCPAHHPPLVTGTAWHSSGPNPIGSLDQLPTPTTNFIENWKYN